MEINQFIKDSRAFEAKLEKKNNPSHKKSKANKKRSFGQVSAQTISRSSMRSVSSETPNSKRDIKVVVDEKTKLFKIVDKNGSEEQSNKNKFLIGDSRSMPQTRDKIHQKIFEI